MTYTEHRTQDVEWEGPALPAKSNSLCLLCQSAKKIGDDNFVSKWKERSILLFACHYICAPQRVFIFLGQKLLPERQKKKKSCILL